MEHLLLLCFFYLNTKWRKNTEKNLPNETIYRFFAFFQKKTAFSPLGEAFAFLIVLPRQMRVLLPPTSATYHPPLSDPSTRYGLSIGQGMALVVTTTRGDKSR